MTNLFLGKLRQIEGAIRETEAHISVAEQHIGQLQGNAEAYRQHYEKVLAAKEFCESVLAQVRTAILMLHKLDDDQIMVFEKAIQNQFRLDISYLFAENALAGLDTLNSPTFTGIFTGIPTAATATAVANVDTLESVQQSNSWLFDVLVQRQFQIIREQLELAEIEVRPSNSNPKCWTVVSNNHEAILSWGTEDGWGIKVSNELDDDAVKEWEEFDLGEFLNSKNISLEWIAKTSTFQPHIK